MVEGSNWIWFPKCHFVQEHGAGLSRRSSKEPLRQVHCRGSVDTRAEATGGAGEGDIVRGVEDITRGTSSGGANGCRTLPELALALRSMVQKPFVTDLISNGEIVRINNDQKYNK